MDATTLLTTRAMTVSEFNSLATRQLDWATSPHLTAASAATDLGLFRQILSFSRDPNILDACGNMLVEDLITAGIPGVFGPLRNFARGAVRPPSTAWIRQTNNVATAVGWGNDLARIEGPSDPATLSHAMPQPDPLTDQSPFERLVTGGYVGDRLL